MPLRDQDDNPVSSVEVAIPGGVTITRVVVRHAEISFYDAEGREVMLAQRHRYPGAGLALQFADHIRTEQ